MKIKTQSSTYEKRKRKQTLKSFLTSDTAKVTVVLRRDLHRDVKAAAMRHDKTMASLFTEAMEDVLVKYSAIEKRKAEQLLKEKEDLKIL